MSYKKRQGNISGEGPIFKEMCAIFGDDDDRELGGGGDGSFDHIASLNSVHDIIGKRMLEL